jgi:hypothetical protein
MSFSVQQPIHLHYDEIDLDTRLPVASKTALAATVLVVVGPLLDDG